MRRRFMAALLAATLVFGGSMTALASEAEGGQEEAVAEEAGEEFSQDEADVQEAAVETEEEAGEAVELAENDAFPRESRTGLTWNLADGKLTITGEGELIEELPEDKVFEPEEKQEVTSAEMGEGITKIGGMVFYNWKKLASVTIPNTVTEIQYSAFSYCESLAEVTVPDSVKTIGAGAFDECTSLKTITFNGDAPEAEYPIFEGVTATAYYPAGNQTYTEEVKDSFGGNLTWAEQLPYTDIPAEGECWYRENVSFVSSRGIMAGMTDTEFGPGVELQRSHIATIIYRIAEKPPVESEQSVFPDVPDKEFYTEAAIWAKENDVIKGYDDGNFGPNDMITREDMAVIMYRYAQLAKLDTEATGELSGFPDAEQVSPYAVEALKWAVGKGIISGMDHEGNKTIEPQGTASRAQCAAVVQRFMEGYGL